jgi:hypothetical protein
MNVLPQPARHHVDSWPGIRWNQRPACVESADHQGFSKATQQKKEGLRMRRVMANILDKKAGGVRKTLALLAMHKSGHSFLIIAFIVCALLLIDLHAHGEGVVPLLDPDRSVMLPSVLADGIFKQQRINVALQVDEWEITPDDLSRVDAALAPALKREHIGRGSSTTPSGHGLVEAAIGAGGGIVFGVVAGLIKGETASQIRYEALADAAFGALTGLFDGLNLVGAVALNAGAGAGAEAFNEVVNIGNTGCGRLSGTRIALAGALRCIPAPISYRPFLRRSGRFYAARDRRKVGVSGSVPPLPLKLSLLKSNYYEINLDETFRLGAGQPLHPCLRAKRLQQCSML